MEVVTIRVPSPSSSPPAKKGGAPSSSSSSSRRGGEEDEKADPGIEVPVLFTLQDGVMSAYDPRTLKKMDGKVNTKSASGFCIDSKVLLTNSFVFSVFVVINIIELLK
jgi:hypothetical protein